MFTTDETQWGLVEVVKDFLIKQYGGRVLLTQHERIFLKHAESYWDGDKSKGGIRFCFVQVKMAKADFGFDNKIMIDSILSKVTKRRIKEKGTYEEKIEYRGERVEEVQKCISESNEQPIIDMKMNPIKNKEQRENQIAFYKEVNKCLKEGKKMPEYVSTEKTVKGLDAPQKQGKTLLYDGYRNWIFVWLIISVVLFIGAIVITIS